MTPEPIFWTPNPAAQPGPEGLPAQVDRVRTPVVTAPLPSAMRPAEPPGRAAAAQAQPQALSNLLASLQAATQKGLNRCGHLSLHAWYAHYKTIPISCLTAFPVEVSMWSASNARVCRCFGIGRVGEGSM